MIQTNKQLYQNINEIIEVLKKANKKDDVIKLEDALTISTVSSEVLGSLRLVLVDLNSANFVAQLGIQNRIIDALDYLNLIL